MTIDIGFNAGRICEAIAKIGYEPYTALMDLVDNAVAADASSVRISLNLRAGKSLKSRNSVSSYLVIDDGIGMDIEGVKNAFAMGSDKNYGENSLSKYGLGLKSAGLSLGSKISIVSKSGCNFEKRYVFDSVAIKDKNKFFISEEALTDEELTQYDEWVPGNNGTIVEISGCENVNQASPKSTIEKLKKRLGVTYFSFLQSERPLNLTIQVQPFEKSPDINMVEAKDILFMDSELFKQNYTPDDYDYYSPYLGLDEDWHLSDLAGNDLPPIKIQSVIFPQATLADKKSPLEPDKKKVVSSYEVSRENSGFFIYRNGRLIRWGDGLEGMVGKDDINIRIRMDLQTAHDDVLHVDVTKQRLEIDDENKTKLEGIIRKAIRTAKDVRTDCQSFLKNTSNDEGLGFTATVDNVTEDDPDESIVVDQEAVKRRAESAEKAKEAKDELLEGAVQTDDTSFRKVIYSDKVPYQHVWVPHYDATEGVFVGINKNHPFYNEFLTRYSENSVERIVAEALIFSIGLAETNVRDTYTDLEKDILNRIFRKFHKNIDSWLAEWSTENINLFEE